MKMPIFYRRYVHRYKDKHSALVHNGVLICMKMHIFIQMNMPFYTKESASAFFFPVCITSEENPVQKSHAPVCMRFSSKNFR